MADASRTAASAALPRLLIALSAAAVIGGCGMLSAGQGNPAEPVLVTGRVVDANGRPVGGAQLDLEVNDYGAPMNVGDVVPRIFQQSFSVNADGTFAIHLAPTQALLDFGRREGGYVNFDLRSFVGGQPALWGFSRNLAGPTWADQPEFVELRPIGSQPGGGIPGPTLAPAAS